MKNNRIRITFSTTAGDLTDEFSLNQPLQAIKREVMGRLHLDPSTAGDFQIVLDGNPLDESKTLGELNIPADSILILERPEVVKI